MVPGNQPRIGGVVAAGSADGEISLYLDGESLR